MENALDGFSDKIFQFVTGKDKGKKGLLIKKHTDHLGALGDFSFPNTVESWHEFFVQKSISATTNDNLLKIIDKTPEHLIEQSKNWNLHLNKVKEVKGRIHVFFDRPTAIRAGFAEALKNNFIILERLQKCTTQVVIHPDCVDDKCITFLRLKYLRTALENLCAVGDREITRKIVLTSKSSSKCDDGYMVVCGSVVNSSTGFKERDVTADQYVKIRQDEMSLIAQHKYGLRPAQQPKWQEFASHLGESAVVFELLQTKPSSPVKVSPDHSNGQSNFFLSKKGAPFVLYNCARLATLLSKYRQMVNEGSYPPLAKIEDTDLSLLTNEDEWDLIFNYIMGLPSLINSCIEIDESKCEFRPHLVCNFLSSMVKVFSRYYRKVRILTQPRLHMMPEKHARIHMLQLLLTTLRTCLLILDIKSVDEM